MKEKVKWNYELVKEYVENLGFILINKEYISTKTSLILQDKLGFYYCTTLSCLQKSLPQIFHISNPYTIQNIKLWLILNNKPYILVSDKYLANNSLLILTDNDGYYYSTTLSILLGNYKPNKYHKSNVYTIQNIKLWCKLSNKPFELISETYNRNNKNLKWRCLKEDCGEIFEACWGNINNGVNCSFCSGRKVGLSNCLATKNPEILEQWHPIKNGDLTPYDVTIGSGKKIWWICPKGHEEKEPICNRQKYPYCKQCKNEEKIRKKIDKEVNKKSGADKRRETCRERYGVDNYSQTEEYKQKRRNTNLKKYNTEYYTQTKEYKNRYINTIKEKYGENYTNVFQVEEIKQKSNDTILNKYSVTNISLNQDIKEKKKQTSLEHWGYKSYFHTDEHKNNVGGENSHFWKGGITSVNQKIRFSNEYKEWRNKVYKRDNYTCQCCGDNYGGNLVAHHYENFSSNEELRFDVSNGLTMCNLCHNPNQKNSFHNLYGTKNNTKEQLTEYLQRYKNGEFNN